MWVDKLIQGKKYEFTVIDWEDNKRTFKAEYRGLGEEYGVYILWEDGDDCGRDYDECEIVRAELIK